MHCYTKIRDGVVKTKRNICMIVQSESRCYKFVSFQTEIRISLREIVAVFKKSFAMSRANKTKDNIAHNKHIHRIYVRSSLHQ